MSEDTKHIKKVTPKKTEKSVKQASRPTCLPLEGT